MLKTQVMKTILLGCRMILEDDVRIHRKRINQFLVEQSQQQDEDFLCSVEIFTSLS
jgi:hypothetical protein